MVSLEYGISRFFWATMFFLCLGYGIYKKMCNNKKNISSIWNIPGIFTKNWCPIQNIGNFGIWNNPTNIPGLLQKHKTWHGIVEFNQAPWTPRCSTISKPLGVPANLKNAPVLNVIQNHGWLGNDEAIPPQFCWLYYNSLYSTRNNLALRRDSLVLLKSNY